MRACQQRPSWMVAIVLACVRACLLIINYYARNAFWQSSCSDLMTALGFVRRQQRALVVYDRQRQAGIGHGSNGGAVARGVAVARWLLYVARGAWRHIFDAHTYYRTYVRTTYVPISRFISGRSLLFAFDATPWQQRRRQQQRRRRQRHFRSAPSW